MIILFGRFLLRPLFRLVASTRSRDLFIATVLFVIIAAGVITNRAGMSMALGAFVAGLLLAETEYRRAIEATIDPFKSLLLGIFFFTVGMDIGLLQPWCLYDRGWPRPSASSTSEIVPQPTANWPRLT